MVVRAAAAMSQMAFAEEDWAAVIAAHPLESNDPAEWLRYGAALLLTIEPGPELGRQQQQAALAFLQAQKEGASAQAVQAVQRQSVLVSLGKAMELAGVPSCPAFVEKSELATAVVRIEILLTEKQWLQAVTELEKLSGQGNAFSSLHHRIRTTVLAAFCGASSNRMPADYADVNRLREDDDTPLLGQWQEGLEVTARLEPATPLVLVDNYTSARRILENRPFWIAYGNARSGSTMVFNLLRILANSLSSSAISAWEGDLMSPEKFFDLVDESTGVNLGVLKIHRPHEAVNSRLASGRARAILSCRDMTTACFSYWRMLNNPRSPFFVNEPDTKRLDKFIETEINNFHRKSLQQNTLIVREVDLRAATLETIDQVSRFFGVKVADESLRFLASYLSTTAMRRLAEDNQKATNSTGHERVTYLHPGHIAEASSEHECSAEVREYIVALIRKHQTRLDEDGYIRPEVTPAEIHPLDTWPEDSYWGESMSSG